MKNFLKMNIWACLAFFLIALIVDVVNHDFSFQLPRKLAEREIGPAPVPSPEELVALGYPEKENSKNYDEDTRTGRLNLDLLALNRSIFMIKYEAEWKDKVSKETEKYVFIFQTLLSLPMLGCLWMFYRSTQRWWSGSISPLVSPIVLAKFSDGSKGAKSLQDFVGDSLRQSQLKKQQEEFDRLESLLKSGLITQAQFDTKKEIITAKVQKSI